MSARFASLLVVGAVMAAGASPALAQDGLPETEHETVWISEGSEWSQPVGADLPLAPQGFRWVSRAQYNAAAVQPRGYSDAERDAWLRDCTIMLSEPNGRIDDDDGDGGLIGGIVGAVAGGVAGNRIADGDRLAGTLIGGGLGAVAGAVIGSAIDGDDDARDLDRINADPFAAEYCSAYLRRYEAQGLGGIAAHGDGQFATHQLVRVSSVSPGRAGATFTRRNCGVCTDQVVEIEEVIPPQPVAARAIPARPRPVQTKRIPVKTRPIK